MSRKEYVPMTFDRDTGLYHVTTTAMQVTLEEGDSVTLVGTNPKATVASLVSSYCSARDIPFSHNYVIMDEKGRPLPHYSTLASLGVTDGHKLKISHNKQSCLSREKWPFLIAIVALIICVGGILAISMVYGLTGGKYPDDYGVVMDAGSSKTNTLLYSWNGKKLRGTGHVNQVDSCIYKEGIATMDPMELGPVIHCAKVVTGRVEPEVRYKTPLYFAATAGMRLLNLTDPGKVEDILEQLQLNLTKTGLSVNAIEVISGRDEGIYGWITANFLRQTLEEPQKKDPWVPTTYGALDMGGASAQISYALPPDENVTSDDILPMTLYGQTHNLFAYSNLCFGRAEAESRYRNFLIQNLEKTTVDDPCAPAGFVYTRNGSQLFDTPCTQSKRFGNKVDPTILAREYKFRGTSHPANCSQVVAGLLDNDKCRTYGFKECFRKANNIPDNQKYLAFATYYFTTNFLNVTRSTLREFTNAVTNYCLLNNTEVEKITKADYGKQYCFNGQYMYDVLTTGFGFTNDTWDRIEFVGNIAGKDVGWSLGYMINATNLIPAKGKTPKLISATSLTVCLVLFIAVVIAAVIFILKNQAK